MSKLLVLKVFHNLNGNWTEKLRWNTIFGEFHPVSLEIVENLLTALLDPLTHHVSFLNECAIATLAFFLLLLIKVRGHGSAYPCLVCAAAIVTLKILVSLTVV